MFFPLVTPTALLLLFFVPFSFSKFLKLTLERLLYLTLKFRWLLRIKIKLKRVTMKESLYIRFLHVEEGVPVSELMKRFPGYSRATIFRYMKRPVNSPFNKRRLKKGRPKKLSIRDEQNIVRQISRMRSKIGPFILKRLARESGMAEDVSTSTISRVLTKYGFRYLHSR